MGGAAPQRSASGGRALGLLLVALVLAMCAALASGAYALAPGDAIRALWGAARGAELDTAQRVLWHIRLPRVLLAALAGAALGASGCALQGLFRNPLADPGLVGVSAGAALAAALAVVLGPVWFGPAGARALGVYLLPVCAFAGAWLATCLVIALASQGGRTSVLLLLLAGIAANSLCGAGIGMLQFLADDDQLRHLAFWTLGSLSSARWPVLAAVGVTCLAGLALLHPLSPALDALNLGESAAGHLGVDVQSLKRRLVTAVTLMVGASVAFTGMIGFIGLVAPHLVRLALGPSHRVALPASALGGALLLTVADTAARTLAAPAEVPVGIFTALIGAPFFLVLILGHRRRLAA